MSFNVKLGLVLGIVCTLLIVLSFWWLTKDIPRPDNTNHTEFIIILGVTCIIVLPIGFIAMLYDMDRSVEIAQMLEDYKNLKGKRK
jgi:hypothetical protein